MSEPDQTTPRYLERQWQRAQRYIADEQFTAARASLEALLARAPDDIHARLLLSSVCLELGHLRGACEQLVLGSRSLPADLAAIHRLAYCLHQVGETAAMRQCLDHPAITCSRDGNMLMALAHMQQILGNHEAALALMDRALDLGVDNPDVRYFRSLQLQFHGRMREAEIELESCLRMGPTYGRAFLALARMRRQSPENNHLAAIASRLERVTPGSEHHAALEFARFKELDDLDRREEAWQALTRGNAIMRARVPHDGEREQRQFDMIVELFDQAFAGNVHDGTARDGNPVDGPQPIFVVGMPRSGTTLLERILGNHSQVASPGELPDFPKQLRWAADTHGAALVDEDLLARVGNLDWALLGRRYLQQSQWRAHGKPYYIDKLPPNFMLAGFIHRALPKARILHMRRDPMDVCFSNWKALFGESYGYSYDLHSLAAHHRNYQRLMAHWHSVIPHAILDLDYARLVADPDAVTRQVLAFCELPFESGCSDIARNRNPVSTLSSPQVRQSIHGRALGEWHRYEAYLQPLLSSVTARNG
jgi:tetratricopeptide (TPR) repeat protein